MDSRINIPWVVEVLPRSQGYNEGYTRMQAWGEASGKNLWNTPMAFTVLTVTCQSNVLTADDDFGRVQSNI
jgi:hypothetical protein